MNILRREHSWRILPAAALSALLIPNLFLFPAEARAAGAAGVIMEEMLVTVRKKGDAEIAQDVPLAITTFGADQLDALFVQRLDDLSYSAPNVQLEQVGTFPGVQNFSIRGQGINSSIPSVDPTVGTFVNGVYMGVTYGVVIDMFDVERVEVLRGPQGTLFGRNVTGGAVLLRTARPDGEFGFRVRGQATGDERYNLAADIEGSLIDDVLAGKFVAYYDRDEGYFGNTNPAAPVDQPTLELLDPDVTHFYPATGRNVGELETWLFRPTLVWDATDELELTLIGESGRSDGDGAQWGDVTAQRGAQPENLPPGVTEVSIGGDPTEFSTNADEMGTTDMDWQQVTFELNWDIGFGNGTITNIAGWRDVEIDSVTDVDSIFLPLFTAGGYTEQDQWSNELRYFGTFLEDWDVTLGAYYFEQDILYRESRYIGGGAGADFLGPPLMLPLPGFNLALGGDMQHEVWGLFWNNQIRLPANLTLEAGIRYTDEKKDAQIVEGGCPDLSFDTCVFSDLSGDWDNWTPKIGLDWRFTETAMVYAFWARGVRSGGFNFRNAKPTVILPGPTDEEQQDSYEAGIKSEWFDNRLRANVAVFYNEIDDMQRELNLPDPDVVVLQGTVNAGDATIKGIEFDVVALFTENFSMDASLGIQDGEYDSVNPALLPGTIGEELPRLAPWNYSVGATYDIFLGDLGLITLRANYAYRDENPYNDSNTAWFDPQRRASASVNWTSPEDHWRVSLWGKNLKDEANWGNLTQLPAGPAGSGLIYTAGPMQKGRDYGLEVTYTF